MEGLNNRTEAFTILGPENSLIEEHYIYFI